MTRPTVIHGDMREELAKLIAEGVTVQSIVTDPPYHLTSIVKRFGAAGAAAAKAGSKGNHTGAYARASRGFMGKQWDGGDIAFQAETWRLCWELLPPGGHLLAFSGTRTYHRMACAIEDAGFGSGFPKSHNVAKGIAKRRTEDLAPVRVVCRAVRAAMDAKGLKSRDLAPQFSCDPRLIDHWAARDTDSQPSLPTTAQWLKLKGLLDLSDEMDSEVARLNDRKGTHGARWSEARVVGVAECDSPGFGEHRFSGDRTIRELDGEAAAWEGWGTALKPALEPICVARKPLLGTVAQNVLAHGTGALNIDGCRIATDENPSAARRAGAAPQREAGTWANDRRSAESFAAARPAESLGRWPANVVHDGSDEVIRAFPVAPGQLIQSRGSSPSTKHVYGSFRGRKDREGPRADSGSAARFYYSAKADADDRIGSKHPTVKPVDLMRWLIRLVTPPGGRVLDPFAGSGTTGMACMAEGFDCTLIEREAEYVADIQRRIAHVRGEDAPLFKGAAE